VASVAGLFHDVGKVAVPGFVLNKRTALSEDEERLLRVHPVIGGLNGAAPRCLRRACRRASPPTPGWQRVLSRLGARALPWLTRLVSVVDTFDALVSDRPYRMRSSLSEAFLELERDRGPTNWLRVVGDANGIGPQPHEQGWFAPTPNYLGVFDHRVAGGRARCISDATTTRLHDCSGRGDNASL